MTPGLSLASLVVSLILAGNPRVQAQEGARDPAQPFPVFQTGGHSGLVRSVVFAGNSELLTAGLDKVIHRWDLSRVGELRLDETTRIPAWKGSRGAIYAMALSNPARGPRILAVAGFSTGLQGGEIALFEYTEGNRKNPLNYIGLIGMHPFDDQMRQLLEPDLDRGMVGGHNGAINALIFLPGRNRLVSAGQDGIIRFWDIGDDRKHRLAAARRIFEGLKPDHHIHALTCLAHTRMGDYVVSGGVDSVLRIWNAETGESVNGARLPAPQFGDNNPQSTSDDINSIDISPDNRDIAVGREDGDLCLVDFATLGNHRQLGGLRRDGSESVEVVRFNRDEQHPVLAVGVLDNNLGKDRKHLVPALRGRVELRSMADGKVTTFPLEENAVRACEFSPDNRRFAYSGGDDRAIRVVSLNDKGVPIAGTEAVGVGRGRSIWDVRFVKASPDGQPDPGGSLKLAFTRERRIPPEGRAELLPEDLPSSYEMFDPLMDRLGSIGRGQLDLDEPSPGFRVVPSSQRADRLELLRGNESVAEINLDAIIDKRWWSKLVLNLGVPTDRPAVAIGMENAIGIFGPDPADPRSRTYRMIQKLIGHSGPVYCLALSPDRKWLLSGGADQTVRLYATRDLDRLPPFGATIRPAAGEQRATIESVTPYGFAWLAGLKEQDRILSAQYRDEAESKPLAPSEFDAFPPGRAIVLKVQSDGEASSHDLSVHKTRNPTASLLALPPTRPDQRGQLLSASDYAFWMPSGYYLTSIRGDNSFLGWHQNQPMGKSFVFHNPPVQYRPASDFEGRFLNKGVIDAVLRSGGNTTPGGPIVGGKKLPPPPPELVRPPVLVQPQPQDWRLEGAPTVTLSFSRPKGDRRRLSYRVTPRLAIGPPKEWPLVFEADGKDDEIATLGPIACSKELLGRTVRVDIAAVQPDNQPLPSYELRAPELPKPLPPREPRVQVLAVGASGPGAALRIEGLRDGAEAWKNQTHAHLAPVSGGAAERIGPGRFLLDPTDVHLFLADSSKRGAKAPATEPLARLVEHLNDLVARAGKKDDSVPGLLVLYLEAHVLELKSEDRARGSRILLGTPHGRLTDAEIASDGFSIPADAIIRPLTTLSEDYHCRVVVFLDGIHEGTPPGGWKTWRPGVTLLTRALQAANVTVANASESLPSPRVVGNRQGAMAAAWQNALDPDRVADGRIRLAPESSTLLDYSQALRAAFEPYRKSGDSRESADPVSWTKGARTSIDSLIFAPEIPGTPGRVANAPRIGNQKAN